MLKIHPTELRIEDFEGIERFEDCGRQPDGRYLSKFTLTEKESVASFYDGKHPGARYLADVVALLDASVPIKKDVETKFQIIEALRQLKGTQTLLQNLLKCL